VCEELKIQSQNDTAKLAEAKQRVYLKVGKYRGQYIQGSEGGTEKRRRHRRQSRSGDTEALQHNIEI
jgi:hypothetical protein